MTVNRRSLAGAGLLAVLGTPSAAMAAPRNDDARLAAMLDEARALAGEYAHLLAKWWVTEATDPDFNALADRMGLPHRRLCDLADTAMKMKATTLKGFQAKAVLLQHAYRIEYDTPKGIEFESPDQELAWSLLCDLTGST